MRFHIWLFKSEKSMRAVVTGGIGGVVDTFGKSLKYATCFGKFTAIKFVGTGQDLMRIGERPARRRRI